MASKLCEASAFDLDEDAHYGLKCGNALTSFALYVIISLRKVVKEQNMDINLFMRHVGYFMIVAMNVILIYGTIRSIVQKKLFDVIQCFCVLVFNVFLVSSIIFGGSAFLGDAPVDYDLYENVVTASV